MTEQAERLAEEVRSALRAYGDEPFAKDADAALNLLLAELARVAGELDEAREEAQELAVELVNERILHNATTAEAAEIRSALRECPCNCQWIAGQQTYYCRRCAALARGGQTDE